MRKIPLHWQIIGGMVLGLIVGGIFSKLEMASFVTDWIKPFGKLFIRALTMIAIPLVIASLIKGLSDLKDISKFSRIGGKTVIIYLTTTVIAVTTGLLLVNTIQPGNGISEQTRTELIESNQKKVDEQKQRVVEEQQKGPLQPLIDLIPENIFNATTNNKMMLQIIFFSIFFGIAIIMIPPEKSQPIKSFFDSLNEVVLKMIDILMLYAPFGVFALIAALVAEAPNAEVLKAVGIYAFTVVLGLFLLAFVLYPMFLWIFAKVSPFKFYQAIAPAQLLAFSTSSSAATLPVTMECVEDNLGVKKEVSSFVLPVGATINMDGTSLYQGVAAVFIAQVMGNDLTLADQLSIVVTATLASIGTAAVPGAGLLMLIIVLQSIGVPPEGIALVLAPDRILDMCRTTVNVTGDATVSVLVASGEQNDQKDFPSTTNNFETKNP